MKCRHCQSDTELILDLGASPPSNSYLTTGDLGKPECYIPLKVCVCCNCWLVQTVDYLSAEALFTSQYAYFSSASATWLRHAEIYSESITRRLGLNERSFVIEIASNDGYLLRNFVAKRIPCLGIEPTASTAEAAEQLGIPVIRRFFGESVARDILASQGKADLVIANNVFAHVPDINGFTESIRLVLKDEGIATIEFPHVLNLLKFGQFDTVYHEHYSYLSLHAVDRICTSRGLKIWHVEELSTHGGSLRVYCCLRSSHRRIDESVAAILSREHESGLTTLKTYVSLQHRANDIKYDLLDYLIKAKRSGLKVAGYGAAAKGNTLLNYSGVKPDLLPFICDVAPSKQGKYMPGSRIPILAPDCLYCNAPDILLVLPWNIITEVVSQYGSLKSGAMKFVTAVPAITVWEGHT